MTHAYLSVCKAPSLTAACREMMTPLTNCAGAPQVRPGFAAYMPPSSVAPQQPPQQPKQQLQPLQQQQTQQQNQQRRKVSGGDAAEQLDPGKPHEPAGHHSRRSQKQQLDPAAVAATSPLRAADASLGKTKFAV